MVASRSRKRLKLSVVILLVGGGLLLLVLGWRTSSRAIHPPAAAIPWSLADYPNLKPDELKVSSSTGVTLAGRFFAGRERATIVLSHGYGGNQDELLPAANALHEAGFSVLTYDLRGTGRSGGEVTFGDRERADLRSVIDYATRRPDVDPERIGAFGFSMGGATTLMEAADDPRVKAVVADSAWSDVKHWLKPSLSGFVKHPTDHFSPLSLAFVRLRTGTDFGSLKPERVIAKLSPRPLLLIHGDADDIVPFGDAERNLRAAGEPKELWRIPGAAHGDTVRADGPLASQRVVAFFEQALRP
jgi:dipeptidyl aminopeptidase/acylaminoacyl peptidase